MSRKPLDTSNSPNYNASHAWTYKLGQLDMKNIKYIKQPATSDKIMDKQHVATCCIFGSPTALLELKTFIWRSTYPHEQHPVAYISCPSTTSSIWSGLILASSSIKICTSGSLLHKLYLQTIFCYHSNTTSWLSIFHTTSAFICLSISNHTTITTQFPVHHHLISYYSWLPISNFISLMILSLKYHPTSRFVDDNMM